MAIPSKPRRGLQDINTHAVKVRQATIPYKAFMRLSCLEMEKFRRAKERASAMNRVSSIDARFAAIDEEKSAILGSMGEKEKTSDPGSQVPVEPKNRVKVTGSPFKLKY